MLPSYLLAALCADSLISSRVYMSTLKVDSTVDHWHDANYFAHGTL
jgi:hypothetical protein